MNCLGDLALGVCGGTAPADLPLASCQRRARLARSRSLRARSVGSDRWRGRAGAACLPACVRARPGGRAPACSEPLPGWSPAASRSLRAPRRCRRRCALCAGQDSRRQPSPPRATTDRTGTRGTRGALGSGSLGWPRARCLRARAPSTASPVAASRCALGAVTWAARETNKIIIIIK